MRYCCAFLLVLAGLLGSSAGYAETVASQKASLRGVNMTTFGRIIFDFEVLPKYEVKSSPGMIMITFDQSLTMQLDNIGLELPIFVSGARLDPDRKVLRIITLQKLTTNLTDVAEDLYLDLLPETWKGPPPGLPVDVIADLSRRARVAELELRRSNVQSRAEIVVQSGSTSTLSRLSLFAGGVLPSRLTNEGRKVELVYEGLFKLDLGKLRTLLPRGFSRADVLTSEKSLTITIEVNEGLTVKTGIEDGSQVLDIQFKGVGGLDEKIDANTQKDLASAKDSSAIPDPIQTSVVVSGAPAPGSPETAAGRSFGPPVIDPAFQVEQLGDNSIENIVTRALSRGVDDGVIRLVYSAENGGEIDVLMPDPAPVAAFIRGGSFWFIADSQAMIDASALLRSRNQIANLVETERKDFSVLFRLPLPSFSSPTLRSTPTGWKILLFGGSEAAKSVGIFPSRDDSFRAQLVSNISAAGRPVWLDDPVVGDKILVIPSADELVGVSDVQMFPEFWILPTLQGVTLSPLVDDLQVKANGDEFKISTSSGLNLSEEPFGASTRARSTNLIVMEKSSWLIEKSDTPWARYKELFFETAMAPQDKRTGKRLGLARFLAVHGLFAEADGVFGAAMLEDRELAESPFNILEGAIYKALAGHYPSAEKDLSRPELTGSLEAWLWRSFVAAKRQNWVESVQFYGNAGKLIDVYPPAFAVPLRLAIGEATVEQGEWAIASDIIEPLANVEPDRGGQLAAFLRARVLAAKGDPVLASAELKRLAASEDRAIEARARLELISQRLGEKKIDTAEAIAELQTIALSWRGDFIEAKSLMPLVGLLLDQGEWREGLLAARRINLYYAEQMGARSILNAVTSRLTKFFEDGKGAKLTDISALSIFMDFKEFLPVGRQGDELIRALSDRFVEAELLPQAAELLKYQVDNRYEGVARASIGARLAFVYLLDKRPLSALEALSSTRLSNMPEDIRRSRLLIEARARAEVGNPQLALEILEGQSGLDMDMLRGDIYWFAKNNAKAGEMYEKSLDRTWAEIPPLSPEQARIILKAAIAYALANDNFAIERLKSRYSVKMARTQDGAAFRLLTLRADSPPALARELAGTMTSGKYLDGFLAYYKERYLGTQS